MSGELAKLAHQLGVPESELGCVAGVPDEDLRTLRRQIADALFEADKHHFTRLANLAKAVPVPIAAKVSELVLPPLLSARTAEVFDPQRAADMVNRMSARYVADVAAAMDPARSPAVVGAMPPESVSQVGAELAKRGEWVVVGAFVSYVSEPALEAAVEVLGGAQLLRISYALDDMSRIDELSALLTDQQVDDLLVAVPADGLWRELDNLLAVLGQVGLDRLRARFAVLDPDVQAAVQAGPLAPASHEKLAAS